MLGKVLALYIFSPDDQSDLNTAISPKPEENRSSKRLAPTFVTR